MSSGAYVVRAPQIDPAVVAFYASAVADGAREIVEDTREFIGDIREINEEKKRQLQELDARSRRISESIMKVIEETEAFRKTMSSRVFTYDTVSDRLSPQAKVESTKVTVDMSGEELLCMEINPDTGEIAYVVLDYSDALAVENARNSSQYKKFAMASDVMKRLLVMASADKAFIKLKQSFIEEINKMLDDDKVDFEQFRRTVERKLEALQGKCRIREEDAELWSKYCALCARAGKQPELLAGEELKRAVEEIFKQEITAEYYVGARKAFFESAKELGMHVEEKYELVNVPGALLVDSEIPAFGLFFTDSSDSFLVEILDTEEVPDTPEKKKQHENMCKRRKQLEALMEEKGYTLMIVTESDAMGSEATGLQERRKEKESAAETMRRRRAINGKKAKIKAAGGKR